MGLCASLITQTTVIEDTSMNFEKLAKTHKISKDATSIKMDVLSQKTNSKVIFRNFGYLYYSLFRKINGKNHVFCDFLKNGGFWLKMNITIVFFVIFPFLLTIMHWLKSYISYPLFVHAI